MEQLVWKTVKVWHTLIIWSSNLGPKNWSREITYVYTKTCTQLINSFVHNWQRAESPMFVSRWTDKWTVIHSCCGIQLSSSVQESQKHAEQKKPDTKSTYCMVPFIWDSRKDKVNLHYIEQICCCWARIEKD